MQDKLNTQFGDSLPVTQKYRRSTPFSWKQLLSSVNLVLAAHNNLASIEFYKNVPVFL